MNGNAENGWKLIVPFPGTTGSELLVLAEPIEARTLQLEVLEFSGGSVPCLKLDFLGCQRTSCEGSIDR